MLQIIDHRQTGKTTKLIRKAVKDNAIIVVPTFRWIPYIQDLAKEMQLSKEECSSLRILSFHDFMRKFMQHDNDKYYIDELDACLQTVGVLGYSNSIEEENQNGSEI